MPAGMTTEFKYAKEETIKDIFQYLASVYRSSWTNQFTPNNKNLIRATWDETLAPFSREDCIVARDMIQSGLTSHNNYPPNPLEFAELCKIAKKRRTEGGDINERIEHKFIPPRSLAEEVKIFCNMSLEEKLEFAPKDLHQMIKKSTENETNRKLDDIQRADDMRKELEK